MSSEIDQCDGCAFWERTLGYRGMCRFMPLPVMGKLESDWCGQYKARPQPVIEPKPAKKKRKKRVTAK